MAGLEAVLRISAQDDTAKTLAAIKEKIAGIEKTAAGMSKFVESVGAVTRSTDPLAGAVTKASQALATQRNEIGGLVSMLDRLIAPADRAASAQRTLAHSVEQANRAITQQGHAARAAASAAHGGGGHGGVISALGLLGVPTGAHEIVKAIEGGADLEQLRFRIRAAGGAGESAAADRLAASIAARYPSLSTASILDTYQELRANAINPDGSFNADRASANLMTAAQAQVAAKALGVDLTPHDTQNLLKSMEGTGRANDPTALSKTVDAYLRAKQMYGSAVSSDALLTYVQNAKSANFGISDSVFYGSIWARLAEGNSARLGNEFSQTMATLVGGHMTKQGAQWLVSKGLINQNQIVDGKGGKFYIRGNIKNSAMLSADPTTWADAVLLPALKNSGVLDDAKLAARMRTMGDEERKRTGIAPNEAALRERAEAGLISDDLYKSGFRGTVVDQIAHAIVNSPLINRDTAAMGKLPGAEIAADIGKNPVAAFSELTSSISNFSDVLTSPALKAAAPALDALAHSIGDMAKSLADWQKLHPQAATAASGGVLAAAAAGAGWLGYKMYGGLTNLFGGGGEAAGGAMTIGDGVAGGLGLFPTIGLRSPPASGRKRCATISTRRAISAVA